MTEPQQSPTAMSVLKKRRDQAQAEMQRAAIEAGRFRTSMKWHEKKASDCRQEIDSIDAAITAIEKAKEV